MKKAFIEELKLCLDLWSKQGFCNFGGKTKCERCAVPYLLYKLITGEVIHKKLTLDKWNKKYDPII